MASVEGKGTSEERVIAVHGRGRFLGELSLLTGECAWYSAVAVDAGEVLAVPVGRLRELVARDPAFGDLILRAYLLRRSILIGLGAGLRIVGSKYSPDTGGGLRPGTGSRTAGWIWRPTRPPRPWRRQFGVTSQDTPVVIVHGRLLRNPSNAELAAAIGLSAPSEPQASCDMLVVGSGPAGLSAAVYGDRRRNQ